MDPLPIFSLWANTLCPISTFLDLRVQRKDQLTVSLKYLILVLLLIGFFHAFILSEKTRFGYPLGVPCLVFFCWGVSQRVLYCEPGDMCGGLGSLVDGEFLEIHRGVLEFDPCGDRGRPSIGRITHGAFLFCVCEDSLNGLRTQGGHRLLCLPANAGRLAPVPDPPAG